MGKQDIRSLALGAVCLLVAANATAFTPPRDGGPLPKAPPAMSAWDKYAQVLLETNEFLFVD